jgi:hypothetical protein
MLFRPEEVHPRSPPGAILRRTTHLTIRIAHNGLRADRENLFIAHHYGELCTAVETGGIHTHHLARKQPADR